MLLRSLAATASVFFLGACGDDNATSNQTPAGGSTGAGGSAAGGDTVGGTGGTGGTTTGGSGGTGGGCNAGPDEVDLLIMMDNGGNTADLQAAFLPALEGVIDALTNGAVPGQPAFQPVRSLRVAVITPDLGAGGFTVPTCLGNGDDGVFQTTGNGAGCATSYPTFLEYEAGGGKSPEQLANEMACIANVGSTGCGFQQPLEAALKALSPADASYPGLASGYAPPTFENGTGQLDGPNGSFLRESAVLAVLFVTNDLECSAADTELYNPPSVIYPGNLPDRCWSYPGALHALDRYVDGLTSLRPAPMQLVVGALAGIPADLIANPTSPDFNGILADSRMQHQIDPGTATLQESCSFGNLSAFPPRRLVELTQSLDAAGSAISLGSLCAPIDEQLEGFVEAIGATVGPPCVR